MHSVVPPDPTLRALIGTDAVTPTRHGASGATVLQLTAGTGSVRYLKYGTGAIGADIAAESARLQWAAGRIRVPTLIDAGTSGAMTYQLTTAVAGESAFDALTRSPSQGAELVSQIAAFLRALHALPVAACPFDAGHAVRMREARQNIDAGRVDPDDFDDERAGWSAEQVWSALQASPPLAFDPVVTHGDCSLDNLLVHDGRVTGCIDVGRLGVADRYQDLAILWNGLSDFDERLQATLWHAYGITAPDRDRLRFHLLLDELF